MLELCKVEKLPILTDNFVFIIYRGQDCIVVDPGEATAVIEYIKEKKLNLKAILITHHHHDHVGGVGALLQEKKVPVYGPAKENIPHRTHKLNDQDSLRLLDLDFEVKLLPGHTLGHIAYWIPEQKWLFSGDVLFALGCGRLFEGTPAQMLESLEKIKALPNESLIFCTHDYFPTNKKFCEAQGLDISEYDSLHPLILAQEKEFNPFLIAKNLEEFTQRRQDRNRF